MFQATWWCIGAPASLPSNINITRDHVFYHQQVVPTSDASINDCVGVGNSLV